MTTGTGLSSFSFDKYIISQNDVIGTSNTGFSVLRTMQQLQNLTSTEREDTGKKRVGETIYTVDIQIGTVKHLLTLNIPVFEVTNI